MFWNKKRCTEMTVGKIIDSKSSISVYPGFIIVSYTVDGIEYTRIEIIKLKSEVIKFGFLPIGQKTCPKLENRAIGSEVRVMYNPKKPKESYLLDNQGIINSAD